jgi:hypothetical protein
MNRTAKRLALASIAFGAIGAAAAAGLATAQNARPDPKMSFFITSVGSGKGGDLGGLAGADAHCESLAKAVGAGGKGWKAYLSATPNINARDRIGKGPWYNFKGVQVASSVDDLHSDNNKLSKENSLTEKGTVVNGRGDTPNMHDIMTGSTADGRLAPPMPVPPPANAPAGTAPGPAPQNMTCNNWTSSGPNMTPVGHHDRQGGGAAATSWNAAHNSRSCSQPDLVATGGAGLYYCFATK